MFDMSSTVIPATIKGVRTAPKGEQPPAKVVDVSFSSDVDDDEVIVRVKALGLNPTDYKHVLVHGGVGALVGCDAAGDVVKVGSHVKHVQVGDRVAGFAYVVRLQTLLATKSLTLVTSFISRGGAVEPERHEDGVFAEYARFKHSTVLKLPTGMSYEEGASFPIPHITAYQAINQRLGIALPVPSPAPDGRSILIWGASTAVGTHAIQLAKLAGLKVFATSSPSFFDEAKKLGADAVFDYRDEKVVDKVREGSQDGIVLALDCWSGDGTIARTIDSISSKGGRVIVIGRLTDEDKSRRDNVDVSFTLAYTAIGRAVGAPFNRAQSEAVEDAAFSLRYVTNVFEKLVEGWTAGEGSPKFKTQKLRIIEGGLDAVWPSLELMQRGEYAREKLVIRL